MTNTVPVSGNKTLGEGDDGTVQRVDVAADITLPHKDTWTFLAGDEFEIVSNTDSAINIIGEEGVTLTTSSTITTKGQSKRIKYQGNNAYLIWSVIIIIVTFGVFTYKNTTESLNDNIISTNYSKE